MTGLPECQLHQVPLERIFVRLNTTTLAQPFYGASDRDERRRIQLEGRLAQLEKRGDAATAREVERELARLERTTRQPQTETLSVADALHKHKCIVIIGGPGSGKTALTRWLALTFARDCLWRSYHDYKRRAWQRHDRATTFAHHPYTKLRQILALTLLLKQ